MKRVASQKLLPRLVLYIAALEVLMGIAYLGVYVLQQSNSVWCYVLQLFFQLLHTVMTGLILTLALQRIGYGRPKSAVVCGAVFLCAILLKDLIGYFIDWNVSSGYDVADALALAAVDTLFYTFLLEGVLYAVALWLAWLLFLRWRDAPDLPASPFDFRSPLLSAVSLTIGLITVRLLASWGYETVQFGQEYFWMLTSGEVALIVLDFVWILLGAFLSYLASAFLLCRFLEKEPGKRNLHEEEPTKRHHRVDKERG
jgi:hypothetical protein